MTNTKTTAKANHYLRGLTALVVMAVMASTLLVAVVGVRPAHASTTFTVNSTSDLGDPNPNDGRCVIPDFSGVDHCTLRAAIQNANGTQGPTTIEFYSNPADSNEGRVFIGERSVTASADGLRSFSFTPAKAVSAGRTITATATDTSTHDTSEFSAARRTVTSS